MEKSRLISSQSDGRLNESQISSAFLKQSQGAWDLSQGTEPAVFSWDLLLWMNFLCGCARWRCVRGWSGGGSLFQSPDWNEVLAAAHVCWHVAQRWTWLGLRLSLHSLQARSFLLGCQGNPGAGRKTSHLLSTELRDRREKTEQPQCTTSELCGAVYSHPGLWCLLLSSFQFYDTCSGTLTKLFLLTVHLQGSMWMCSFLALK